MTKRLRIALAVLLVVLVGAALAIPWAERMARRRLIVEHDLSANQNVHFFGKVVDQDGIAVVRAKIACDVERFRNDNYFGDADKRTLIETLRLESDASGSFDFQTSATTLRITAISFPGHTWIQSGQHSAHSDGSWRYNHFYQTGVIGRAALYKGRPDNPAVFVLLKDDAPPTVRVRMARGGEELIVREWYTNHPFWPEKTKPKGITYCGPTTLPTSPTTGCS